MRRIIGPEAEGPSARRLESRRGTRNYGLGRRLDAADAGLRPTLHGTRIAPQVKKRGSRKRAENAVPLFKSSSNLPASVRQKIVDALLGVLTDGMDLYGQIKVAHWNVKGAHFAALHPLFDTYATAIAGFNDAVAERCVTLGGLAVGTAKHVAKASRLPAYPQHVTADLRHVQLLADRFATFVDGAKEARRVSDKGGDLDTSDLLTEVVSEFEKHGWFLRATLED
jgi:starvation-inducible DNA-binding protein